jgi:hypothetical protein
VVANICAIIWLRKFYFQVATNTAKSSMDINSDAYKNEFLELVKKAEDLKVTAKHEEDEF